MEVDNFLEHLKNIGKKIHFMGVDIWTRLYPHLFTEAHSFDSFSALDLDSVDNGVKSALYPLLENKTEWNLIICIIYYMSENNLNIKVIF